MSLIVLLNNQGEELRKQIGASFYIECSSKTQQVCINWYLYSHNASESFSIFEAAYFEEGVAWLFPNKTN